MYDMLVFILGSMSLLVLAVVLSVLGSIYEPTYPDSHRHVA